MEDCDEVLTTVGQAARCGHLDAMKELIEEGHPIDAGDNRGWRPLHEAAHGGFLDCLQHLLLIVQRDVNCGSHDGQTALHLACVQNNTRCVELLLLHGADPNSQDFVQCTPLHKAMLNKNMQLCSLLLDAKADVNCQQYCGTTPLHHAATEGLTDLARLLLEKGAALHLEEEYGITPIFSAAQFNHLQTLKVMLRHAKDSDQLHLVNKQTSDGATPLFLASQEGHLRCISLLLDYGADANICTSEPTASPLLAALQFDHVEVVKYLLPLTSAKCSRDCSIGPFYFSTLHQETTCTELLIAAGLDVNERRTQPENESYEPRVLSFFLHQVIFSLRMTPLTMLTVFENPINHAKVLIKGGAYLNPRTPYEVPPLLPALDKYQLNLAVLLIKYGATVNLYHPKLIGNIALASTFHYWKGLNLLLSCGAEVESLFKEEPTTTSMNDYSQAEAEQMDDIGESNYSHGSDVPIPFWWLLSEARHVMSRRLVTATQVLMQLMHFVGNVQLKAELKSLTDSEDEWKALSDIQASPRPLVHLCRQCIRKQFKPHQLLKMDLRSLPLPSLLLNYISYKDVLGDVQYSI